MSAKMGREEYLLEMGLGPIWVLRDGGAPTEEEMADQPDVTTEDCVIPVVPTSTHVAVKPAEHAASAASPILAPAAEPALPSFEESGYGPDAWAPPTDVPGWLSEAEFDEPDTAAPVDDRTAAIARMNWDELEASIAACRACVLCQKRKQAVPGVGDRRPDWLLIGEGPGADEDERGEPFVGQAGKLLDNMLAAIDLKRGDKVYIANAVKCRPPGNRTPEAGEIAACWPYLKRQIELAQPKLMLLMGRAAVTSVLANDNSIASLRGKRQSYGEGVTTVVTYHPAYLLRNLPDKAKAWEDLCFARGLLAK